MYDIPILFLIFNRPDTTEKVFSKIREIKPGKLYIAADGPRQNKVGEVEKCREARAVLDGIDWECDVKTLFRDENLGCKVAVSEAITWFFQNEEMGIILEDDCLPNNSFFLYCKETLEKYKNEDSVMMISGDNFQKGQKRGTASYYFTKFPHIWGWASWRRAWNRYDVNMKDFPLFLEQKVIENIFPNDKLLQDYWIANFNRTYQGGLDTWDYQWVYTIYKNNGLCVAPNYNLISNIGFREDATHTKTLESSVANMPTQEIESIKHPDFIVIDSKADEFSRNYVFFVPSIESNGIVYRIAKKLKRIIWK